MTWRELLGELNLLQRLVKTATYSPNGTPDDEIPSSDVVIDDLRSLANRLERDAVANNGHGETVVGGEE
jgi:hypothetical protein